MMQPDLFDRRYDADVPTQPRVRQPAAVRRPSPKAQRVEAGWNLAMNRREDGIQRAADHAGADWQDQALECLRMYALEHEHFLTEDVREFAAARLDEPPDGRAWGAVVRRAVREKVVERDGYRPARSSNLSPKPCWRSLIHAGFVAPANTTNSGA